MNHCEVVLRVVGIVVAVMVVVVVVGVQARHMVEEQLNTFVQRLRDEAHDREITCLGCQLVRVIVKLPFFQLN